MVKNYIIQSKIINLLPLKIIKAIYKKLVNINENLFADFKNNYTKNILKGVIFKKIGYNSKNNKIYSQ